MVDTLRIKRRAAGGAAGAPPALANAEIAYNEQDDTLYYGKGGTAAAAASIIPVAGSGTFATKTYVDSKPTGSVTVADSPPASPLIGALWFDTANLGLYVYENDGNSSQWVVANATGGATVSVSDLPPPSPANGTLWYDSANTGLYVFENDGTSSQWIVANAQNVWADALSDGRVYGRQNAAWVPVPSTGVFGNVGRNFLHNPVFTIAQRGAGPFTVFGTYTLDRWVIQGNTDTASVSQVAIADAGRAAIGDETATYILANAFTGNSAAAAGNWLQQRIEGVRRLSGKTVIVSFWANATVPLNFGVSIDQIFGQGGSPSAQLNGNGVSVALTTTWARYSVILTVPSASGKTLGTTAGTDYTQLDLWYSAGSTNAARSGNVGVQSGQINIWGVQLEVQQASQTGPTPLDYGGTPQQQLAECQRYYQTFQLYLVGQSGTAGQSLALGAPPGVTMRATGATNPATLLNNYSSNCAAPTVTYQTSPGLAYATTTSVAAGSFGLNVVFSVSADL